MYQASHLLVGRDFMSLELVAIHVPGVPSACREIFYVFRARCFCGGDNLSNSYRRIEEKTCMATQLNEHNLL